MRDHWYCLPLTGKAIFVQLQLPKLPHRHGSIDQQFPLCSSQCSSFILFLPIQRVLFILSCPRIIVSVAACLTKKLSFPTIHKSLIAKIQLPAIQGSFYPQMIPAICKGGNLRMVLCCYVAITDIISCLIEHWSVLISVQYKLIFSNNCFSILCVIVTGSVPLAPTMSILYTATW